MIVDNNEEITTKAEGRKMCSSAYDVAENLCSSESHDTFGNRRTLIAITKRLIKKVGQSSYFFCF